MKQLFFVLSSLLICAAAWGQRGGRGGGGGGQNAPLASLKTVAPPQPTGLDQYVKDQTALIVLGKTLFWDMQAGSDGRTACASCHFHAGADHRVQNQLSGQDAVVNEVLTSQDFPFHKLANTGDNRSAVLSDKQQVSGSMGVVTKAFVQVESGNDTEISNLMATSAPFMPNGIHVRQVTTRNSPSVINSVYNVRNFWDGRASNVFTGATPFGDSDRGLHALAYRNGQFQSEAVRMENASLASQATGPVLSSVEMSWAGRSWPALGRKLLSLPPLARQKVSPADSVLGAITNPNGNGLRPEWSYSALIQAAFRPEYYSSPELSEGYTQAENNFGLFWGLAIQAYESTLIANDSRVDQFLEGRTAALTALEQQGLNEFRNGGAQCTNCHNGAELTAAGWSAFQRRGGTVTTPADSGFFRIGLRPIAEDVGLGGNDDFDLPLFSLAPGSAAGTFKAPGLRNVEFTGPYFHNGSQATLEQVLDFYGRNADFPNGGNLGPGIGNIRLGQGDRTAIVSFLKALSDDRVRFQRAPFDHPSVCVPNGHAELSPGRLETDPSQSGSVALDKWALVPEVGRDGASVPLQTFDELLRGVGNDGTRANTMTTACTP
jgi:cytochrome c peroxidase